LTKKADIKYLRYRYNSLYKKGDVTKAKEVSDRAKALHGVDLEQAYHAKLASKEDPKDPFGVGRVKRLRYG
tara:strand:- start:1253 stop:1465 length:213 start_codon:yes stop_codon:yes gene_type:complete